MKKTLLALAIVGIAAPSFAGVADGEFDTSLSANVGGYYWGEDDYFDTDYWATALTVASDYTNGNYLGYLEVDLKYLWTTQDGASSVMDDDVDKAWLGYETGYGVLSYGLENDTALDKVDGKGDLTVEFGSSASDASDKYNVIKFQGTTDGVAYGVSYFDSDFETNTWAGLNGYLGYKADTFEVYAGYEGGITDDAEYSVTTITGNVSFGEISVGANLWTQDFSDVTNGDWDLDDRVETDGYYISAGYALSDSLEIAAGFASTEQEDADAVNAINASVSYTVSKALTIQGDVRDNDGDSTDAFVIAYYSF